MSVTFPYNDCLWCLSSEHDVEECGSCQRMNPKGLKEQEAKLFLAKAKKKEKHRSHRRSSSGESSRSHKKRRQNDSRCRSDRGRSRSRSPSSRHRATWEVSPTATPSPRSPQACLAPSVLEVVEPQDSPRFSPGAQSDVPDPVLATQEEQGYPAFPAPGADPAAFLNAMFNIFNSMAPSGALAGPTGPLAFSTGALAPYRPAPFMPFCPAEGVGPAPVPILLVSPGRPSTPVTSPARSMVPMTSPHTHSTLVKRACVSSAPMDSVSASEP
ncbi:hypothetical protein NDU88_007200 [Pleurodeles waltl]|uniref:Uncharacterized protein n=1 Tax=Pleurodeles waltl TaxID=8319 RepID=A0AAV7RR61_PLEWA|nr:hypothetical protein NDU88_007200 [Pleurodeles waltl]